MQFNINLGNLSKIRIPGQC